jgi:phenylalanyl-tRNA synthetase beta chain
MKFSEQWLREWVNPSVDTEILAEQLTMAGLEVDAIEDVAADFEGVLVGKVLKVEPHPDADRLTICQIAINADAPLNIVCGANNVKEGIHVPVAVVGAILPGDFKIKKSKLRGVESQGMLCSAKELGLAETADGLMILPDDATTGINIRDYLALDDKCIELGLTPNRGDCLSIAGIAREVGVLNKTVVNPPQETVIPLSTEKSFPVKVSAEKDCPRYVGRVIEGINPLAQTPVWMQERLRRSGIRSLSPVVDVTNYVLLELGQPMHAFDLDKLDQGINVRQAEQGEKLVLLDGKEIVLEAGCLVIADHKQAIALAGIMGGEETAVNDNTQNIFLESAFFNPITIAGRARGYGLHTDSSHRFERGVDPQLQRRAVERATQLLLDIVGGKAGDVVEVVSEQELPARHAIVLNETQVSRILGMDIPKQEITSILERLDMELTSTDSGWQVTPPSFRFDIAIEVDLIEEIGRIYGYNSLPVSRPKSAMAMMPLSESSVDLATVRQALVDRGYQEVITYTFVDPKLPALLDPELQTIELANPISADMAVMRTNLWAGLLQTVLYNINRQQSRVRIFEQGLKFYRQDGEIKQESVISGLIYGELNPEQWGEAQRPVDFYDLKGDVESLLTLNEQEKFNFVAEQHPALHPGQSARIMSKGKPVGWIGALHPKIIKNFKINGQVFVYEVNSNSILQGASLPKYQEMSKFPAVRRDLAIIVDDAVTAKSIDECIKNISTDSLQNLQLFDMFKGKGIDSGKKSLALSLTLQHNERTLTDDEVDTYIHNVLSALEQQLDAKLRD